MHAALLEGNSVTARLYRLLVSHIGKWYSGWGLAMAVKTTAVSTRISEVRHRLPKGEKIEVKHTKEGWFYRLVRDYEGMSREEWERAMHEEHNAKYDTLIEQMGGLGRVKPLLPVSVDRIRAALKEGDQHLNSIPLAFWDRAAGVYGSRSGAVHVDPNYPFPPGLSAAERVSLLKRAAVRAARGE